MSYNEKQLLNLKDDIEKAAQRKSELTGQKQVLMKQLEESWKCKSTEEVDKKIQNILNQIQDLEEKIENGTKELEDKYDFN